jgi:HAD superfamily hydrolase (TIGR01459 family)
MDDIRLCQGISDLCDSYTGYLIDQWGVLHDGTRPYEGVLEALAELKSRKKQLILLSNSGKRVDDNIKRLQNVGIDTSLFNHIITSGELAWLGLKERKTPTFEGLGDKCYLIARAGDEALMDGLGLTLVDNPVDATFIFVTGVDAPPKGRSVADLEPILRVGVHKRLKMVCANPDLQALIGVNTHAGPGAIAKRYEEFGGIVKYIGKPFPAIFKHGQSLLKDVLPSTTLVVGDSLPQDIMGGLNCGLDTCLVATGVHAASFKSVKTMADCAKVLRVLGMNFGARPNYWVPRFHWGKALLDRKNKRRKNG